jgi:hypothetical protein
MALAVPVQGLAAVAAGLCMAIGGHHQTQSVEGHGSVTLDHDHAAGDKHSDSDHGAAGTDKSSSDTHCPPCVSCCAAAVIAPAEPISLSGASPIAAIAAPQYTISGVLPEKLDRPPLAL